MNIEFDPSRYTISVRRVTLVEGQFYEATVKELPDVVSYHEEAGRAFEEAREAIVALHEAAVEERRPFPAPASPQQPEYSGRVTLRLSKTLHAQIAQTAEMEGVSLNALLNELVACREAAPAPTTTFQTVAKWLLFAGSTSIPTFPKKVTVGQYRRMGDTRYIAHQLPL